MKYPLIDIDLGIGRKFFYDDPFRVHRKDTYEGPVRWTFVSATCHPNRKHEAHGMCGTCYKRWWANGKAMGLNTALKKHLTDTPEC